MSRYKPESRAKHLLRYLADHGTAPLGDLVDCLRTPPDRSRRRHKVVWIMKALVQDGFAESASGQYRITQAGLDAMTALEAGHTVETSPTTYVRYFERAA